MEDNIAAIFRQVGSTNKGRHTVNKSAYYEDRNSNKIREIDVHIQSMYSAYKRGIGGPVVSVHSICECKNLHGYHLIFSDDQAPDFQSGIDRYWVGVESELHKILHILSDLFEVNNAEKMKELHRLFINRAYNDSPQVVSIDIPLPEVDVISRAFRETNSDKNRDADSSVIWKAILSLASSRSALKERYSQTDIEWVVHKEYLKFYDDPAKDIAFFLDARLMMVSYYHAIIFVNSPLWKLADGKLSEVNSCRLYLHNMTGDNFYVDIVSYRESENYLRKYIHSISKTIDRGLVRLRRDIRRLEWFPGQKESDFKSIIKSKI